MSLKALPWPRTLLHVMTRGAEEYTDDLESQSQVSWDQDLIVKKQMLAHAYTM